MRTHAHRKDGNHNAISSAFRALGCSWMDCYQLGDGRPDGFVGYGGRSIAIEIKDPKQIPSKRKLTPDEKLFCESWKGGYRIVETLEEVRELVAMLRQADYLTFPSG